MGGLFQGHVDQKHMCQFHACLELLDKHLELQILGGVLCVLSYIVCANHWYEKHLQGHLKWTLNHKNYQQKKAKHFVFLKDSKG